MDAAVWEKVIGDLDSKDTKRRVRGLEALDEKFRLAPPGDGQWSPLVTPLLGTLRDNNFKVCKAALRCLEALVGHVDDRVAPFLPAIIPATVECLGNSKSAVHDKGVDLLLAVADPAVNGAEATLSTLERGAYFRHKNWRVREQLVRFLGRATEVDGAGVCARPAQALAGLLAEALNDSASQVRQEAAAAAVRVVEVFGASFLATLEAKDVRPAQLSALRERAQQQDDDDEDDNDVSSAASSTTKSDAASDGSSNSNSHTGDDRNKSPTTTFKTPAPVSRVTAALRAGGRGGGRGSGSRPTSAPAALLRRRTLAPSSLRAGGGVGVDPTMAASAATRSPAVAGGNSCSPTSRGTTGAVNGGGAVEESAFSALEPLVPISVYTERDVRREVEAAKVALEHGSDWLRWVGAMQRLAGVALGGAAVEFPELLVGLVRSSVHEAIGHKVSEIRSAVAREACRCVAVLARGLTDHFGALAELWLPELLRNTTRAVIVAAAGDEAARAMFGCTTDGFSRLLPLLSDAARNKSAAIRRRCLDYLMVALARWGDAAFERHLTQTRNMVATAVADADSSVRATARRTYWVLKRRFPMLSGSIMGSLDPSSQRHVLREEKEFDAKAFIEAVTAAAENPQPALGESLECRDGVHADNSPSPHGSGAATGDAAGASTSPSTGSSKSSSIAAAARRIHGAHQPSSGRPARVSNASATAGDGAAAAMAVAPGGVKSSRVKRDRGAVANSNGGRAPVRMRGRLPQPEATENVTDVSFGSAEGNADGGGGIDAGSGAPLRVTSGAVGKVPSPMHGGGDGGSGGSSGGVFSGGGGPGSNKRIGALRVPRGNAVGSTGLPSSSAGKEAFVYSRSSSDAAQQSQQQQQHRSGLEGPLRVARRGSIIPVAADRGDAGGGGSGGGGGVLGGPVRMGAVSRVGGSVGVVHGCRVVGGNRARAGKSGEANQTEGGNNGGEGEGWGGASVAPAPTDGVVDRVEVLRQADDLVEQAGVAHWSSRVDALQSLLELLTTECRGERGQLVLESRPVSKRLEAVIAERARDAHFKVVAAALKLLGGLVAAHPDLMAGQAFALLPLVFPSLADAKEPVRQAASQALDACRAAYAPHQLCAALCPRVLELPPGRARTGLLEFLAVLVPHASSFLASQEQLHALTQRLATALLQSPPPANWDGDVRGGGGGGGGGGKNGGGNGIGSTSTVAAYSAATRLLAALFRLNRDALLAASNSLSTESTAAVRRALVRAVPDASAAISAAVAATASSSREDHRQRQQHQWQPCEMSSNASEVVVGERGRQRLSGSPGPEASPSSLSRSPSAHCLAGAACGERPMTGATDVYSPAVGAATPLVVSAATPLASPPTWSPAGVRLRDIENSDEWGQRQHQRTSPGMPAAPAPAPGIHWDSLSSSSPAQGSASHTWVDRHPETSVGGSGGGDDVGGDLLTAGERNNSRLLGDSPQVNSALSTPLQHQQQQQQQQQQRRRPLAPLTSLDTNTMVTPVSNSGGGGHSLHKAGSGGGRKNPLLFTVTNNVSRAHHAMTAAEKQKQYATPPPSSSTTITSYRERQEQIDPQTSPSAQASAASLATQPIPDKRADDEPAEVARGLMAGLSTAARTHQKVAALSSLRGLADGGGAGARADFWPRYFGQVLMLLLEGASNTKGGGGGATGGGMDSSPSRKRAALAAKHVQGVRCLVARRGRLFPGATEVVVGRLVEIGGRGSHHVRLEVEACLADLVGVLEPSRFLAVLVPFLMPPSENGRTSGISMDSEGGKGECTGYSDTLTGGGGGLGATTATAVAPAGTTATLIPEAVLVQCVALGALRALTACLPSPSLLDALGAGPLLRGVGSALGGQDLEARRRAVLVLVEMYQVLEEALLPFLSRFPTNRLKLITMYIEQRRARDHRAVMANEKNMELVASGGRGVGGGRGRISTPVLTMQ